MYNYLAASFLGSRTNLLPTCPTLNDNADAYYRSVVVWLLFTAGKEKKIIYFFNLLSLNAQEKAHLEQLVEQQATEIEQVNTH